MNITLAFHGGVGAVTGSNFLLTGPKTTLMIDCGLIQGEKFAHDLNRAEFPYDPSTVDFLVVTHAHIDHVGRIPKLVRDGFSGRIISTEETFHLAKLMLPDAFSVLRMETAQNEDLLYDEKDVERAFSLWETLPYHEARTLGDFDIFLKDSGHILGSAMVEVTASGEQAEKKKIVFTGDLGNTPTPLLNPAEPITDATYIVMESVYGDRNHEGGERRKERLKEVIQETVERKGVLLIPCFSLEKTQVLLSEMDEMYEDKKLFTAPVFLDSPLAIKVTNVYRESTDKLKPDVQERLKKDDDIFSFPNLKLTMDARESSEILRAPQPKIIIAGSGMSAGGRILDHERRYLGDPDNTILFIGYQAVGGLGRRIQEGQKNIRINHDDIKVKARIETITGYSSHMDSDHLIEFASKGEGVTEKIFVVMGDPKSSLFLAQRIQDYVGIKAHVPEQGEKVEISL